MNLINVIQPYRYLGTWVFDDPRFGFSKEPFEGGAATIIDRVTSHIPDVEGGFTLLFSGMPFPGREFRLEWRREEGGNVYYSEQLDTEGSCAPLFSAILPKGLWKFMSKQSRNPSALDVQRQAGNPRLLSGLAFGRKACKKSARFEAIVRQA